MTIAVQVQNWLAELLCVFEERIEEVTVITHRFGMAENHET